MSKKSDIAAAVLVLGTIGSLITIEQISESQREESDIFSKVARPIALAYADRTLKHLKTNPDRPLLPEPFRINDRDFTMSFNSIVLTPVSKEDTSQNCKRIEVQYYSGGTTLTENAISGLAYSKPFDCKLV